MNSGTTNSPTFAMNEVYCRARCIFVRYLRDAGAKKSHARNQMHSWPFYSCCLRGWRSSICGTSNRRLQRRHEEENDDEEAQEVPGNSISPRANTFPPGCLLCYILARRMGGLLKRLVVTFEHCPFFTLVNGEDWSYENLRANRRAARIPTREMVFAGICFT